MVFLAWAWWLAATVLMFGSIPVVERIIGSLTCHGFRMRSDNAVTLVVQSRKWRNPVGIKL